MRLTVFSLCLLGALSLPVLAEGQGIVVTVNDRPVTTLDITQRAKLLRVMRGGNVDRKEALQSLIDDIIKLEEAKKLKADPDDKTIDEQLERMAKNNNSTVDALYARFKAQGVSKAQLRSYVASQIAFNRVIGAKGGTRPKVDDAAINKKYAELQAEYNKIANDPRMKPITVYSVQEIFLPVESNDAMASQLIMARAVEAKQYMSQYKGCKSARAAASGIFNVKIGKTIEADASKLPKPLKDALDKVGPGGIAGPARTKVGLQLLGFCGKRSVSPKMPTMPSREAIANSVAGEQLQSFEDSKMAELRPNYVVDYKDKSLAQ